VTTTQPYAAGTLWTYRSRSNPEIVRTEELAYLWEPNGSPITDEYLPSEITAVELWHNWVTGIAAVSNEMHPNRYQPGDVTIAWFITTPTLRDTFEGAPGQLYSPTFDWQPESFLTHFTHPVNAKTGDELNWLRLPVIDRGWNAKRSDKGGFIQEVLGWKPAPLQHTMNVYQLQQAAGIA